MTSRRNIFFVPAKFKFSLIQSFLFIDKHINNVHPPSTLGRKANVADKLTFG